MQSVGQGGKQSSQPVHSSVTTMCMRFGPPTMASTGQAWMHLVQPMQSASITLATSSVAISMPKAGLSGFSVTPSTAASRTTPTWPPGGHWSMSASRVARASA